MASRQPPYEDVHKARNNHRRTRLNAMRAMCLSSHLNGSAFALLYISPIGEIETFSTTSLRPYLGSWFNVKVRKEAKRSAIKYFRTRRRIQGDFAIANDFRGEYEVEDPEAPTRPSKPRRARSRAASARAIAEDDWEEEDSPMLGAESTLILPPLEANRASESGAIQAAPRGRESPSDGSTATTHLMTPGPVASQNKSARSPSSAGVRPPSNEGGLGRSPSMSQLGLNGNAATGRRDLDAHGRPTPPLSTSPTDLEVTLSQPSPSPRPPPCRLVPTLLDPTSISRWYLERFSAIPHEQQYELCGLWIRALEPDHKVKFPYKTTDATSQPTWWPTRVPHKPPSRLSETERALLLEAMIQSHDRPLHELEEMTAQDSFAISLELDYLLTDIYKVVKLQRRGQNDVEGKNSMLLTLWHVGTVAHAHNASSPKGAPFPAFSVEVLPLDSDVLDFVSGSQSVVPEDEPCRTTGDTSMNVLASPIKPNERSSTSGSKGSRHRSRSSLSSAPSTSATTVFGASPAPRARTFAHPYALPRSVSVQDVGMNGLSLAGSQPLSRSHFINGQGTSLDDAMANKERGIASNVAARSHRTPGPKQGSDLGNVRAQERPSTSTTSAALQRALENGLDDQDDATLKSPSDGASGSRRSHHREPAFASPAMIKSASRNMVFESIPEGLGTMAPSPSRSAPVAIAKKPAGSKPLSRQGSRTSTAKKDRVHASAPKPITIHPAHQLGDLAVECAGADYPTPTYSARSHMARSQSASRAFQAPAPAQRPIPHPHSSQFPQSSQFQSTHLQTPTQYGQPRYTIPHPQQHQVMHQGMQYEEYDEQRMLGQPQPPQAASNTFVVPAPEDPSVRTHHQIVYSPREANTSRMRHGPAQVEQHPQYLGPPDSQYFEAQAARPVNPVQRTHGQPVQQDTEGPRFQHHSPYPNAGMVNQEQPLTQGYSTQPTHYYHNDESSHANVVQYTGALPMNDYSPWPAHQQSTVGLGLDEFPGAAWDGAMFDAQAMQGLMQQQHTMPYGL
ncbi:BQ2448_2225 [Microbotryum intermedium]|uniref:BQ2448_2225 protein n=1 Tax=Microbotryum intermedium TaxID=269621 RepID=A0A238F7M9_9BASI|nr:BQ2448_2225 [Microbotryum intermedium]